MKGSGPNRSLFPRHGSVPFAAQLQTGIFQLPLGLDAARAVGLGGAAAPSAPATTT